MRSPPAIFLDLHHLASVRARSVGRLAALLRKDRTHLYVCRLKGLKAGVDKAQAKIRRTLGLDWPALRSTMREQGRLHVETG